VTEIVIISVKAPKDRKRDEFVLGANELAARLHERLMRGLVQVLSVESGQAICEICGVEVCQPKATCRKCSTPHHRECWDYNGRCSIYACGHELWR